MKKAELQRKIEKIMYVDYLDNNSPNKVLTNNVMELIDQYVDKVIGGGIPKDFGYGYITVNGKKRLADEVDAKLLNDLIAEQRKRAGLRSDE